MVELLRSVAGYLDVLFLVSAHRYHIGVVEQNVCRHKHRVVEKPDAYLLALRFRILEGVRPREIRHRRDGIEYPCKLCVFGNVRLFEDNGLLWVQADSEIINTEVDDILLHYLRILDGVQRMVINDHEKALMRLLHVYKLPHRAEEIPDMGPS